MWIARDKDGDLYIYQYEPRRSAVMSQWKGVGGFMNKILPSGFPDLK